MPGGGELTNRRIRETRELSTLARVLESRRATAVLEQGRALDEAELFIESRQESLTRLGKLTTELKLLLSQVIAKTPALKAVKDSVIPAFTNFEGAVRGFLKDAEKSDI